VTRPLRILALHADDANWATLSYARSLPRAAARHPGFDLTPANIAALSRLDLAALLFRLRFARHDAVVLFHSTFSNVNYVSPRLAAAIGAAGRPVVQFLGNEYKLMPEKMDLARRLRTALLITQISRAPVSDLYRAALGCETMFLPNATFEPDASPPPDGERDIDIGYRAFGGVYYLGHDDREKIATLLDGPARARGLRTDISLDPARRFDDVGWSAFLRRCRAQLGAESGSDAFELTDATRLAVNRYCESHPHAAFDDVRKAFFADGAPRVSGRTISSRHLEAAAARCVQILFDGEYAGIWRKGEHYLAVERDGSNVADVLDALAEPALRARVSAAAFDAASRFSAPRMMADLETAIRGVCA
jgi:hypothetical protein